MRKVKSGYPKPTHAPAAMFALYDSYGEIADMFSTRAEAKGCAWGPRFRFGYTIVRYVRARSVRHAEG